MAEKCPSPHLEDDDVSYKKRVKESFHSSSSVSFSATDKKKNRLPPSSSSLLSCTRQEEGGLSLLCPPLPSSSSTPSSSSRVRSIYRHLSSSSLSSSSSPYSSIPGLAKPQHVLDAALNRNSISMSISKEEAVNVDNIVRILDLQGYCVIKNFVDEDCLASISNDLGAHFNFMGRNQFEGFKTSRVYSVFDKTRALDAIALHHIVQG